MFRIQSPSFPRLTGLTGVFLLRMWEFWPQKSARITGITSSSNLETRICLGWGPYGDQTEYPQVFTYISVLGSKDMFRVGACGGTSLSLRIGTDRHHPSIFRHTHVKLYGTLGF